MTSCLGTAVPNRVIAVGGIIAILIFTGCSKTVPPDHVKLHISTPGCTPTNVEFRVIVNNADIGSIRTGGEADFHFPAAPNGNNTIELKSKDAAYTGRSTGQNSFYATAGAEGNVQLTFEFVPGMWKADKDFCYCSVKMMKYGDPPSIGDVNLDSDIVRRESPVLIHHGPPGQIVRIEKTRTIKREVMWAESAKQEIAGAAKVG